MLRCPSSEATGSPWTTHDSILGLAGAWRSFLELPGVHLAIGGGASPPVRLIGKILQTLTARTESAKH